MANEALCHHGIKGMRWGVRRFQNEDGSLTSAGKKRYQPERLTAPANASAVTKRVIGDYNRMSEQEFRNTYSVSKKTYANRVEKKGDPYANNRWVDANKNFEAHRNKKAETKKIRKELKEQDGHVLLYGSAMYDRAAKYVSKHNMSYDEALKKSKKEAWVASAIMASGAGALTLYQLKSGKL